MLSFHSANTVSTYITNPKTSNKKCCAPNCWHRNRSLIVFNSSLSVLLFILLEHGKVKTLFFFFLLQHGVTWWISGYGWQSKLSRGKAKKVIIRLSDQTTEQSWTQTILWFYLINRNRTSPVYNVPSYVQFSFFSFFTKEFS
jgi:hypothetical protein